MRISNAANRKENFLRSSMVPQESKATMEVLDSYLLG